MADRDDEMETLDRATCFDLHRTVAIGRVAWAAEDGHAVVLPVNFVVDDDGIVFRTSEGSKLDAVREGHRLSFEADDVEPALHVGWSVLVTGVAEIRPKPYFIRVRTSEVTGRRLPLHPGGVTIERQDG